jgi:hypothetical protein
MKIFGYNHKLCKVAYPTHSEELTMNTKQKLIEEIEQTPDIIIEEVFNFLLFTKSSYQDKMTQNNHDIDDNNIKQTSIPKKKISETNFLGKLIKNPIQVTGFKPLTRDEIYQREI